MKKEDVERFDEFAIVLWRFKNAVSQVPYGVAELHNPKTMRAILRKLRYYMQESWRRKLNELKEKMQILMI